MFIDLFKLIGHAETDRMSFKIRNSTLAKKLSSRISEQSRDIAPKLGATPLPSRHCCFNDVLAWNVLCCQKASTPPSLDTQVVSNLNCQGMLCSCYATFGTRFVLEYPPEFPHLLGCYNTHILEYPVNSRFEALGWVSGLIGLVHDRIDLGRQDRRSSNFGRRKS